MSTSIRGHGNVIGDNNVVTVTINGREETRLFVNVPPQPRLLVGRDALLDDLKARLMKPGSAATAAISAVRGLPGVGKTTLAAALAYDPDVLVHFGGGIFWGDLGPSAKKADAADPVLRLWAEPLGVDVTAYPNARALARAIGSRMAARGKPVLLILDDAWAWDPLIALCEVDAPGSARLLTTRQPPLARAFAGDAGAVADVEELLLEESLDLLRKLAPRAVAQEPDAARELATLTGGLPLALTLVGCALAAKSAGGHPRRIREAIADLRHFTDRFLHLPPGAERTLCAAIASSDQLVNDPRWFALGVFAPKPADFDEEAALAVLAADAPLTDAVDAPEQPEGQALLDRLCDVGLLENVGERYALHQTIAEYVREQMPMRLPADDPRPRAAVERHAHYYLALANAGRKDWQRIEAAWPQIQHAWTWVSAWKNVELVLEYVWALREHQNMRGLWCVEMDWIERGLEAARIANCRGDEGTLLHNLAWVYDALGDKRQALASYEAALAIRREVDDRAGEGATLNNIGLEYRALGDPRRALDTYEAALAIRRDVGDRAGEGATLNNIGRVYQMLGDLRPALDTYEAALVILREVGDRAGEGITLNNIGSAYRVLRDLRRALDTYEAALAILREVGDRAGEGITLNNIGRVYRALGDDRQALATYEAALAIHREVGDRTGEGTTLNNIGGVYDVLGDKQRALATYEAALAIHREVGDRAGEGVTLHNIGRNYLNDGDKAQACTYLEQALAIAEAVEYAELADVARKWLARATADNESGNE